jgi:hypothetical protein
MKTTKSKSPKMPPMEAESKFQTGIEPKPHRRVCIECSRRKQRVSNIQFQRWHHTTTELMVQREKKQINTTEC